MDGLWEMIDGSQRVALEPQKFCLPAADSSSRPLDVIQSTGVWPRAAPNASDSTGELALGADFIIQFQS